MRILLICAAGMSTSLVVEKMKRALGEDEKDFIIKAKAGEDFEEVVENYDVILLGPQIRFRKKELEKKTDKPIGIIDTMDYGLCRGDKILQQAKELFNSSI
ncbi:PTS sugar transporter subunit IIB [Clostridium intestinale]|jgi:PTS system cellobiose-specific IIB component|uniref:PTS system lactose/cellobiose-specific transporter subunit IIB n=1 Tax=Clostridium intestinale URNW TaxID=1294142 RepID=U2NIJ5_9CLOT|nr:PTS sugar transporter subunit IIB [Clostridium intestinale]ERK28963.1 PTS system lactose/cellobiose-specific transporter subunit IIB [Clostridium intestinale URNW]